jgi:hypothetical protein
LLLLVLFSWDFFPVSFCTTNCSKDFQNQRKIAPKKINMKMLRKKTPKSARNCSKDFQNQHENAQNTSKISMHSQMTTAMR